MAFYLLVRQLHILTALITALLMLTRLGLDALGHPYWRKTPLRWLPHVNDTLLLVSALGLVWMSGWMPLLDHWLTFKVALLMGYILTGKQALDLRRAGPTRILAAIMALTQLGLIFALAIYKPL